MSDISVAVLVSVRKHIVFKNYSYLLSLLLYPLNLNLIDNLNMFKTMHFLGLTSKLHEGYDFPILQWNLGLLHVVGSMNKKRFPQKHEKNNFSKKFLIYNKGFMLISTYKWIFTRYPYNILNSNRLFMYKCLKLTSLPSHPPNVTCDKIYKSTSWYHNVISYYSHP